MARGAVVGWFTAAAGVRHAAVLSPLFVDLGIVPGDAESVATGINDNNSVVGYSWDPSNYKSHAFIWTRSGGMHVLPSFETFMFPTSINKSGQISATGFDGLGAHDASLYTAPSWQHLELFNCGCIPKDGAVSVNNSGQVTGTSIYRDSFTLAEYWRAYIW